MFLNLNKENTMEKNSDKMNFKLWKDTSPESPLTAPSLTSKLECMDFGGPQKNHFEQSHYLLIKYLPSNVSKNELTTILKKKTSFQEIIQIPNSKNIYAKFSNSDDVEQILLENEQKENNGLRLNMISVKKLPLDLNQTSKIVLVTLYNEKTKITLNELHKEFSTFGLIAKMVIFQKKNYQIFIEFVERENAVKFKKCLHNTNYKGKFYLKIQFTQKTHLRIKPNNPFEKNFITGRKNSTSIQDFSFNSSEDGEYVLKIKKISNEVKHKTLFNLFSIYGVILKISIDKQTQEVYLYFNNKQNVLSAIENLQDIFFFDVPLNLSFMNEDPSNEKNQLITITYSKENKSQGKQNKPKKGLKPTSILYIYNLNTLITLEAVKNLFQTFEEVEEIRYTDDSRSSGLVYFKSVNAAVKVLCIFKNVKLMNKTLKITFAEREEDSSDDLKLNQAFSLQNLDHLDMLKQFTYTCQNLGESNFSLFGEGKFMF